MFTDPFPAVEIGALVLFGVAVVVAARSGRQRLIELLSASVYGLLLEQGDILIFGTYKYSEGFSIVVFDVPVVIGLCWAVIIYGSMRITDSLGVPRLAAAAGDALLALSLDLAFDAVAIRQGLWQWNIALDQGYFGVPAGNFYAWLWVAFGFSYLTRVVRDRPEWRQGLVQWGVPIAAYAGLLFAMLPYIGVRATVLTGEGGGLPAVVLVAAVFALIAGWAIAHAPARQPADVYPVMSRLVFHGYFLGALIALRLHEHAPVLLAVSLTLVAFEAGIAALAWRPAEPRLEVGNPELEVGG